LVLPERKGEPGELNSHKNNFEEEIIFLLIIEAFIGPPNRAHRHTEKKIEVVNRRPSPVAFRE
jgi:hypothetical protein